MPTQRPAVLHLVEVGGRGGVYQHAVAVASAAADFGMSVVLHSASDAELLPPKSVRMCPCFTWPRAGSRRVRRAALARQLVRLTRHIHKETSRHDIVHVQGASPMCSALVLALCLPPRQIVYSPHNTFSRSGKMADALLIRTASRYADVVPTFSRTDARRVAKWGGNAVAAPLVQTAPTPNPEDMIRWRDAIQVGDNRLIVSFVGQIRADKRPELIADLAATMPQYRFALIGEDLGALDAVRRRCEQMGVDIFVHSEYLGLSDFCSAIAASDVVVAPYAVASQSGVLAVARQLGTASVSSQVGGLAEYATAAATGDDVADFAFAIEQALRSAVGPHAPTSGSTVNVYAAFNA